MGAIWGNSDVPPDPRAIARVVVFCVAAGLGLLLARLLIDVASLLANGIASSLGYL